MAKNIILLIGLLFGFLSPSAAQPGNLLRDQIRTTYSSQIGVRELTGRNDGKEVEAYLKYVWLAKGNPWCAAFVSWCYGQNKVSKPRSGGCVQLMEQGKLIYISGKTIIQPEYGDVFFIWFENKKRVAHTGFIEKWSDTWVDTVEGNTNEAGSREGDGVYHKKRLKRQIYSAVKYL
ncbi:CHAP domain-containing protein [Pedobacter antarcticus]|uniref:CHAP domain-containing protein n=1 Tax=Pedobacter antarcticus TaxID=34086 RepID=UPI000885B995|nr:CHAP domain-containing protein [Pedobacter antarcticus]SDM40755.1 CHAP domain [Pedobacter antarcticus]